MEFPLHFRCPISMELMQDPVTISTGVTYERKNIEKWFNTYKKTTCPATMQLLEGLDLTPNHTLKRLILSWQERNTASSSSSSSSGGIEHDEVALLLRTIESTPFKASSIKKLRSMIEKDDEIKGDLVKFGGTEVLGHIIFQILVENSDFVTFRACEEAMGVLYHLQLSNDEVLIQLLSEPDCIKSMAIMLQRGSAEARLHTVAILRRMAKIDCDWGQVVSDLDMDIFKSLLELLSDEINTKASSCALDVLIEILGKGKNRLKAIEAGAVCVLIELLPDTGRSKCEKMLFLLKLLCECAEGRSAFVDHGLAISVVTKKILSSSELGTKLGVKILWLLCTFLPTERILEDMLVLGAVKKLLGLLHIDGRSSTKDKAMKIIKLHGNSWRQYPCFPRDLRDYLKLVQGSS